MIEYNKTIKHRIDETFESNVESIKKCFDEEVREKAEHPISFVELCHQQQA